MQSGAAAGGGGRAVGRLAMDATAAKLEPVSYSSRQEQTMLQLVQLLREKGLRVFHGKEIPPGQYWRDWWCCKMQCCKVVLLLLSSTFIASDACNDEVEATKSAKKRVLGCWCDSNKPRLRGSWPLLLSNVQLVPKSGLFTTSNRQNLDELLRALQHALGVARNWKLEHARSNPALNCSMVDGSYTKKIGGVTISFPPQNDDYQKGK